MLHSGMKEAIIGMLNYIRYKNYYQCHILVNCLVGLMNMNENSIMLLFCCKKLF